MSFASRKAESLSVCTAWCALEITHTEDYEVEKTILCLSEDKDEAWKVFIDALPNDIIDWQKRYHHWHASDFEKILYIIPNIAEMPWVKIEKKKLDWCDVEVVHMYHDWDEWDNRVKLTFEQKEKLYELFGADWDMTSSSSVHFQFSKMALVPVE